MNTSENEIFREDIPSYFKTVQAQIKNMWLKYTMFFVCVHNNDKPLLSVPFTGITAVETKG